MKKAILTVIVAFVLHGLPLFAQTGPSVDSSEAKFIAEQLMDSSVVAGIFESSPLDGRLRSLKSGVMPELEKDYLETMINNGLTKLNTVTPLKGNFDSIIYIKTPTMESDAELPVQFLPYPSTKWFLLLRSPYNEQGQPKTEWIIRLDKPKVKSFLNPNTIFETVSNYQGNVCLNWDKNYEAASTLVMLNDDFIKDMSVIMTVLNSNPAKGSPQRAAKLQAVRGGLRTNFAKAIVSRLR